MKKNKIKQNVPISRNNKSDIKNKLSFLATNAKNRLNQNQNLNELITIKRKQISRNKENLTKFSSLNLTIKNGTELENQIIKEIKSNNKELLSLNKYLNEQINNLNNRYESLKELWYKNNESLVEQLNIVKDRKFIYENVLAEKEVQIRQLDTNLTELYFQLYKDLEKREILFDDQYYDYDEELSNNLNNYKDILFNKCLGFNKYKNMSKTLKKQSIELKNKIKNITRYINTLKNLNNNFDFIDFSNYNNNLCIEGEECMKENNDISDNIRINTDDSILLSNEAGSFETEEEIDTYDIIINSLIEENSKLKLDCKIPKIDLSQINYNKRKLKFEDKEKSLSRNNEYDKDIYSIKKRKIKKKIKLNMEKKEILIEKLINYKKKIKELKENVYKIKSTPKTSFKIKSIKKRKFLFNSTVILSNNSLSRNINNIISDNIDNLNKKKSSHSIGVYK
jgi:hypothetical protein